MRSTFFISYSGEVGGKVEMWTKMFVEVSSNGLRFCDAKDHKDPSKRVTLPLVDASVSLQEKRVIKLDCESGIRLFRPSSEVRAARWFYVLSCYCSVAPSAEGELFSELILRIYQPKSNAIRFRFGKS